MWEQKARAKGPVTKAYAQRVIEKDQGASADVTARLVGMIVRGDSFDAPAATPPLAPTAETSEGDAIEEKPAPEEVLVPCAACEGDGRVTQDELSQPFPAILREIKEEGEGGRTRLAIKRGALTITDCPACNGKGKVPES